MGLKACPVVVERRGGVERILCFRHPEAGVQFVKGGIERGETAEDAAVREFAEEAGVAGARVVRRLGHLDIAPGKTWVFVQVAADGLPDAWVHHCKDDGGHDFAFFWHELDAPAGPDWQESFVVALGFVRRALAV